MDEKLNHTKLDIANIIKQEVGAELVINDELSRNQS